jgi:hypothetical protein
VTAQLKTSQPTRCSPESRDTTINPSLKPFFFFGFFHCHRFPILIFISVFNHSSTLLSNTHIPLLPKFQCVVLHIFQLVTGNQLFSPSVFFHSLFLALMMEAARTSETLVNFYQTTRHYNPEDSHLLFLHCFRTILFHIHFCLIYLQILHSL